MKRWLGPLHADPAFVEWFVRYVSVGATPAMSVASARMNLLIDIRDILQVFVSNTVRDLVAGSGMQFSDRGVHALKGVPEPKQVLAVA